MVAAAAVVQIELQHSEPELPPRLVKT